jgi:hypothetical protein
VGRVWEGGEYDRKTASIFIEKTFSEGACGGGGYKDMFNMVIYECKRHTNIVLSLPAMKITYI